MKRIFITFYFIAISIICFAVDNLFQAGGVNNNWSTIGNWSQGTVPTASDGYVTRFDATSPNCIIDASSVCNSINFTGYTNTITFNGHLTVSGDITLENTMTIAGIYNLYVNNTATLTSDGKSFPNGFNFIATKTYTLADDWNVGRLTLAVNSPTINGNTITTVDCITNTYGTVAQGTTTIIISGSWTCSTASYIKNNVTFNSAGTITISGNIYYNTGILTYTAGTIDWTGGTLNVGTCTLNLGGQTLNNFNIRDASAVVTLASGFTVGGTFTNTATTGAHQSILSSSSPTQRAVILSGTATLNYLDATDIDSSGGLTILSLGGVLSNTLNWINAPSSFFIMF